MRLLKGGGEEATGSVRAVCDVCAAHDDRAAVGVGVDAQESSLLQRYPFPLDAQVRGLGFRISDGLYWKPTKRN